MKSSPEQSSFLRTSEHGARFEAEKLSNGVPMAEKSSLAVAGIDGYSKQELEEMLDQIDDRGYSKFSRTEIDQQLVKLNGEVVEASMPASLKVAPNNKRAVHPVDQ